MRDNKWVLIAWGILGLSMLIGGCSSGNTVMKVVGTAGALAATSVSLTSHIVSECRVKKASEVFFGAAAMGVIIYGYVTTESLILGALTVFIATMLCFAFMSSYLLRRIKPDRHCSDQDWIES